MKTIQGVLVSTTLLAAAGVNAAWYPVAQVDSKYTQEWKETFSATTLNRNNWMVSHDCWGGGNWEDQCYIDNESRTGTFHVNSTGLYIHPIKNNAGSQSAALGTKACTERASDLNTGAVEARCGPSFQSNGKVLSAKIRSKVGFNPVLGDGRQGRVEVYARLPWVTNGDYSWQFPAIWMLPFSETSNPMHYLDWPNRGEIDIIENMEATGKVSPATHFRTSFGWNSYVGGAGSAVAIDRSQFHTYAVTWDNFGLVYSVDDVIVGNHTMEQLGISQQYLFQPGLWHLIINYAIHNGKGDVANAALASSRPFEVKWVRYLRENTASLAPASLTATDISNLQKNPAVRTHVCVKPGAKSFFVLPTGTCPADYGKYNTLGCPTVPFSCSSNGAICNTFNVALYRDANNNCVAPYDPASQCKPGCGLDRDTCPSVTFGCFNSAGQRCISDFSVQLVRAWNWDCVSSVDPGSQCPVGCTVRGV
ncbi:hypothetical protein HK102_004924 [Quaeritorhiza haematococci]|nr:hypothetical protein HK102_004924 [Quaeritorhiza haematococci]